MDMGSETYLKNLPALIADKRVSEAEIDAMVRPILATKFRLGLFEKPYVDEETAKDRRFHAGASPGRSSGSTAFRRSVAQ